MKKSEKYKIYKSAVILSTFILGTSFYQNKQKNTYKDEGGKIEVVSENIRNELYRTKSISNTSHLIFSNNYLNDKYITSGTLNKIKEINIDMSSNENLEILQKTNNLKTINIYFAEMLTDKDINYINNSNIENVNLIFDLYNVDKIRNDFFDLSKIENKNIKITVNTNDELKNVIFINYLKNYNESMFNYNVQDYVLINNQIDEIINNIGITKNDSNEEKILKMSKYILDKITYDKTIIDENGNYIKNNNSIYYNKYPLSSILNQSEDETKGICINYSSLFDIFSYKIGIDERMVIGKSETGNYHSWNLVYMNDSNKYVDLTYLDTYDNFKKLLEQYIYNPSKEKYDILVSYLFEIISCSHNDYELMNNIEELKKINKNEINYYNLDTNNEYFYPKANIKKSIFVGLLLSMVVLLIIKTNKSVLNKEEKKLKMHRKK